MSNEQLIPRAENMQEISECNNKTSDHETWSAAFTVM